MTQTPAADRALEMARRVLRIEADAVSALANRLDAGFARAVELILQCHGRVIVSGIGKSGHVARKIAATLASTGTPAYFLHAAEAVHGDLGMLTREDVMIAISNSGESDELLTVVPLVKRQGGRLIAITGNPDSPLAKEADIHLDARVAEEACPLNLTPTASTTAALALGDALAVALLDARGFGPEDFARSHPAGTLGRKLLTHVGDVMRPATEVPAVKTTTPVAEALLPITRGGFGMAAVFDDGGRLAGIFTDGDLRRALEKRGDLRNVEVGEVMTRNPRSIARTRLAVEAVEMMEQYKINQLLVLDANGNLIGALNMHDLFRAKVISMAEPNTKAAGVALMGFDVDGVLTDGILYYSSRGDEMKGFSTRDGHGIKMLADAGVKVAIITGRRSDAVAQRAENLGIDIVLQGIDDKRAAMAELLSKLGLGFDQAGYMGDDVVDLPLLRACGFSATVADGHPLVRERVDHVSPFGGGHGAVREVCEFLLAAQNRLDTALARYLA